MGGLAALMSGPAGVAVAALWIALVLDRHFRSLSPQEREVTSAEPARSPEARPAPAPVSPAPTIVSVPAPSKHRVPSSPALLLAEFALAPERPPSLGVRVLLPLGQRLQLGGTLLFDVGYERERLTLGGEARAARSELRGWLALRTQSHPWFAYAGPSVGLALQRGETRNLPERSSLLRVLWAAGLESGAVWCVSPHFALELSGALTATLAPLSGRFYVDDREVLELRVLSGQIGLAAGYAF